MIYDFSRLENAVRRLYPQCTPDEWAFFQRGFRMETLKTHEFFVQVRAEHRLSFVDQGLMRVYYVNPQGQESTIRFAAEGYYATDYWVVLPKRT